MLLFDASFSESFQLGFEVSIFQEDLVVDFEKDIVVRIAERLQLH